MRRRTGWVLWLILAVFVIAPSVRADAPAKKADDKPDAANQDYYELFKILADTVDQVERNYVKKVDRRELVEAAIQGMLSKLDPYSSYIGPDELSRFKASVESQFGGIGIQISMDGGQLRVLSPIYGTPAYRAGVIAGDRITEINGKSTEGITIDKAMQQLKGQPGTDVTVAVVRGRSNEKKTIKLTRELIHVDTVLGDRRLPNDTWDYLLDREKKIGYVRITSFSRDTAKELRKVLEELQKEKARGLILDLRFNPGGLLSSAIEVSDLFISKGVIVSTTGRNSPQRTWKAHAEGTFEDIPLVLLVNRYSASASEIVAGCLQDHQRAIVIGERTWGKGSVQNVIELENGRSLLKLTTSGYKRPSGKNIDRFAGAKDTDEWGVRPDKGYDIKLPDRELTALMLERHQRDVIKPHDTGAADTKPADTKSAEKKSPDTKSADKPKPDAKSSAKQPAKPAAKPSAEAKPSDENDDEARPEQFVDRQLQKAVDYLNASLARADTP